MYPHRIRLRGPWTCEPLFCLSSDGRRHTEGLPATFRLTMPGRVDFRGGVRLLRPFGYPGRIDELERVWLTFDGAQGRAAATLNGAPLGVWEGTAEFEVTALLQARNALIVEMEATADGCLWDEVALEVRATAFLKDVVVHLASGLQIAGTVAGSSERRLDLYVLAAGQCLAHASVEAGQPFALAVELPAQPISAALVVRLELVDAATIWYAVERTIPVAQSNQAGNSS
jgi:hypothetical protein